jgi:outer membrane protein OmpA-like peptidoglycan-associated protein
MQTIELPKEEPTVIEPPKQKEDTTQVHRYEHNLQVLLGGGYGSMGYSLGNDGKESGQFAANVQLRYLYYFTPNWGIGLGVGFATYGSTGVLNTTTVFDPRVKDSDMPLSGQNGEDYEHRVKTNDWKEAQRAYMLDVPVMVQCTYPIPQVSMAHGPLKIYADLGVDLGFSVAASRQLKDGSIDHMGWYAPWKLELAHIDGHDFYTEQTSDFETEKQSLKLRMPAVGLMADFGFAIPLTEQIDLLVGLYGTYTVNDICADKQDIGWKQTNATGYKAHDFMNSYNGIIGTQYASSVHPWQAGVRVGINFNTRTHRKAKVITPESKFERVNVCDTTHTLQERVETTYKVIEVQQMKRALEKSIIWFDLNSTEPKLEPADILVQVADVLKENPDQRILITGHASKEGNKEKNQQLSENRAKAIVDMLIELGVKPEQMDSRGEGVDRDYIEGQHDISLDRRVEITVIE